LVTESSGFVTPDISEATDDGWRLFLRGEKNMSWRPRKISTAIAILLGLATQQASARVWTDVTGRHHAEAEFVELGGQTVRLRKTTGQYVDVPLARLSRQD
jgi:hypothetical protein